MITCTVKIECHQAHISECRGAIYRSKQSGCKAINIFPEQLSKRHNIKIHTHLTSTIMRYVTIYLDYNIYDLRVYYIFLMQILVYFFYESNVLSKFIEIKFISLLFLKLVTMK